MPLDAEEIFTYARSGHSLHATYDQNLFVAKSLLIVHIYIYIYIYFFFWTLLYKYTKNIEIFARSLLSNMDKDLKKKKKKVENIWKWCISFGGQTIQLVTKQFGNNIVSVVFYWHQGWKYCKN